MLNPQVSLSPIALPVGREFNVFAEVKLDPGFAGRPPSFWVLVFDDSGSMGRDARGGRTKVEVVQKGVGTILREAQTGDLVFAVVFASSHRVLVHKTEIRQGLDKRALEEQIASSLFASGATLMSGALAEVLSVVPVHVRDYAVRVLLITDGRVLEHLEYSQPRQVESEKERCFQAASEFSAANIPIWIGGIGTDYDDLFLNELAHRANGTYFHISGTRDLEDIFKEAALSLASVAVTNLTAQVITERSVQLGRVWKIVPQVVELTQIGGTKSPIFALDQLEKARGQILLTQFLATPVDKVGDLRLARIRFMYDVPVQHKKNVSEEVEIVIPVTTDATAGQLDKRVMTTVAAAQTLVMATAGALTQDLATLNTAQANLQQLLTTAKGNMDAATITSLQDVGRQTALVTARLTTQRGKKSTQTTDELRKLQTMAKGGLSGKLKK